METRLCRICGKLGQNYVHLFKTEGLKNKVETCLPIVVSPHSLLPDTICVECSENVNNFYSFIKNCLQNIIILESQYDITDSCLKTKRKKEKGCSVDLPKYKDDKQIQTDDYLEVLLRQHEEDVTNFHFPFTSYINYKHATRKPARSKALVSYDIDSESSEGEDNTQNTGRVILNNKNNKIDEIIDSILTPKATNAVLQRHYFDDAENDLIKEISQRKTLKRRGEPIYNHRAKMFKMDSSNRRKSRQPKKLACKLEMEDHYSSSGVDLVSMQQMYEHFNNQENQTVTETVNENADLLTLERQDLDETLMLQPQVDPNNVLLPQTCLLCNESFLGPSILTAHIYEMHGIDMMPFLASSCENQPDSNIEKKKKVPNLLKISDLKRSDSVGSNQDLEPPVLLPEEPQVYFTTSACSYCPSSFGSRQDLFTHLRLKHKEQASLTCGLCITRSSSPTTLESHLEACAEQHQINTKYFCQVCKYGENNSKLLEYHVPVHDFLLEECRRQSKMFDPDDYIELNCNYDSGSSSSTKTYQCSECELGDFETFKEFSAHRRNQHSIFHCDLCNKFYGRNSHLWKHVNRLHKGHPSITCQLCYKTSASKYHLSQHFNKIHSAKTCKQQKQAEPFAPVNDNSEDFMTQKFQGFDFQSVKQSFMRQEMLKQGKKVRDRDEPDEIGNNLSDEEGEGEEKSNVSVPQFVEPPYAPKEIDASSDLYTNIITNYTPPVNKGEFKCPKCGKGFHKKTLLKKHKKNCRPRLQKDLLTRCKSCSRIFKDRQSLAKHLVNYHSEYACELCGQKVQSKCEIVAHIRFTHPACHLFCTICGNILRSKADLANHKQDHSNSYICQFCGDALPSKIKLKMHILSLHRKILSLSCGVCLKLFETQHILRDHVRLVHRDQLAPLTSCPVCGKNYGSKWKTYDHLNKSHGRIFKACKTCLEVFDTEFELQSHCELAHNGSSMMMNVKNNPAVSTNHMIDANNIKTYQSESENENDNDNDPDNSDQSNDLENYNSYNEKQSDQDDQKSDEFVPFHDMLSSKSKISLLEKRLLGKNMIEEDSKSSIGMMKNKCINPNLINFNKQVAPANNKQPEKKKLDSPPNSFSIKEEPNDGASANNSNAAGNLQNSSKRTVYVNSNDPSLCEICLKTWPAKKHLWQHYIRCHKSVAATVCGICLKTNPNYASLQEHLVTTHPTLLHGQGFGSNFICRICGRYHNASSKLRLHMAIHENFDWSLLENNMRKTCDDDDDDDEKRETNGVYQFQLKQEPDEAENINYESLIEQVECSESENDDENMRNNASSSDVEDQDDEQEESDNESLATERSERSLESRMLNSMLRKKQHLLMENAAPDAEGVSDSSDSDDSSNSSYSDDDDNENDNNEKGDNESSSDGEVSQDQDDSNESNSNDSTDDNSNNSNVFLRKPEELDSAIKSISFMSNDHDIGNNLEVDYCEMQNSSLNENEIESAVGSIL